MAYSLGIIVDFVSGAIFTYDQRNSSTELAFKYAVHKINKDNIILPNTTLIYDIQYVNRDDSFHASKKGRSLSTNNSQGGVFKSLFSSFSQLVSK